MSDCGAQSDRAFVRLTKVGKSFRIESGTIEVLRNVSIDVSDRQFISILGPSGCGKSTLLMMLAGLEPVSSGAIEIAGQAMRAPRRDVGVIFQDPTLLPWKSAIENVLFPITDRAALNALEKAWQHREPVRGMAHGRFAPWPTAYFITRSACFLSESGSPQPIPCSRSS